MRHAVWIVLLLLFSVSCGQPSGPEEESRGMDIPNDAEEGGDIFSDARTLRGTFASSQTSSSRLLAQVIQNRTVTLSNVDDTRITEVTTNENGEYTFISDQLPDEPNVYPLRLKAQIGDVTYRALVTYFEAEQAYFHLNDISTAVFNAGNVDSSVNKDVLDSRTSTIMQDRFGVNEKGRNSFNDNIFITDANFGNEFSLGRILLQAAAQQNISLIDTPVSDSSLLGNENFVTQIAQLLPDDDNLDTTLDGVRADSELILSSFTQMAQASNETLPGLVETFTVEFTELQPGGQDQSSSEEQLNIIFDSNGENTLAEGQTIELDAQLVNSDGTTEEVEVIWSVKPETAATIDQTGKLTANNVSSDTIVSVTATYGNLTKSTNITILNEKAVTSLAILGDATVNEASTTLYTLEATFDNGTTETVSGATWSITNGIGASIDANGVLTAGIINEDTTVTIQATYQEVSDTHTVTILNN